MFHVLSNAIHITDITLLFLIVKAILRAAFLLSIYTAHTLDDQNVYTY